MTCNELLTLFKSNASSLPYANPLQDNSSYGGWISNLKTYKLNSNSQEPLSLNLSIENDLFLLFVLASCWSRTGMYEQSAYFVAYLKASHLNNPVYWNNTQHFKEQKTNAKNINTYIQNNFYKFSNRSISIKSSFFDSVFGVAKYWSGIKAQLNQAKESNEWIVFVDYLHSLQGLAASSGFNYDGSYRPGKSKGGPCDPKMVIKIPLILREIRIALPEEYGDIPGNYCCVPDKRVLEAAKHLSDLPLASQIHFENLLKQSSLIYEKFGDWYDIPLFAYEDIAGSTDGN